MLSRKDGVLRTVHNASGPPSLTWMSSGLTSRAMGVVAPSYVRMVPVHSPHRSAGVANAATLGAGERPGGSALSPGITAAAMSTAMRCGATPLVLASATITVLY